MSDRVRYRRSCRKTTTIGGVFGRPKFAAAPGWRGAKRSCAHANANSGTRAERASVQPWTQDSVVAFVVFTPGIAEPDAAGEPGALAGGDADAVARPAQSWPIVSTSVWVSCAFSTVCGVVARAP